MVNYLYRIAIFSVLLILYANVILGETEKYGIIKRSERWTAEESPYIISDDLLISDDARLVINPGVQILVGKPVSLKSEIKQQDHLDSFTVSIKVRGAFKCVGRMDNRITFSSQYTESNECQWYGIVINPRYEGDIEIAFTDIANACNGMTISKGSPIVRNCVFEFNNVGISCRSMVRPKIYNSNFIYNTTSGIHTQNANPEIFNCIIAFNRNNGVWSDEVSFINLKYNCIFGNPGGNLVGCNPELGIIKRVNKNKDSTDFAFNMVADPIFAGSAADSLAVETDVTLKTDKSRIKDTSLAKIIHDTLTDSSAIKKISRNYKRFTLSSYSPCINAGNPGKKFNDIDGSKNDIGIFGGQEFVDFNKK